MADGLPIPGVDYAFGVHPSPAVLAAQGFKFACRYGGPGTSGKWLTAQEAADLAAAGISVVANAEGSADGLGNGWNAGVSWARSAESWFRSCGMPAGRPIYFSADFDVLLDDWPAVADALRGAASVIGAARVGVYGSYNVMRWAARDGVAAWFWQTYAWSAGRWAPGNHIEQFRNGVMIDGADCDLNRALQTDYGQWMPGRSPTTEEPEMYYKLDGHDEIYRSDGRNRFHIDSYSGYQKATAAGVQTLHLATQEELDAIAGPPPAEDAGSVDVDQLRAIVREELDKTRLQG